MFGTAPTGAQTQQANPYQNPRLSAILNPINKQSYQQQNLGLGNGYLQTLMNRYMMGTPSFQNAQVPQGGLLGSPYTGKQYKYAGSPVVATNPATPAAAAPKTFQEQLEANGWTFY